MSISRRKCIAGLVGIPVGAAAALNPSIHPRGYLHSNSAAEELTGSTPLQLPAKAEFGPMDLTYLDSGSMHPFSLGARRAVAAYLDERSLSNGGQQFSLDRADAAVNEKFAKLINASPDEICIVQSTTAGEQLVVRALDIPAVGGRIVTDTLHFPGSFYLYEVLGKRGMEVVWIRPTPEWSIDIRDYERSVTNDTRLVALSLVSTINGFQHDLKAICDIAHAKRAYVYADIIHGAGSVPIDVKASGVDFAASATYKWLMGDFGLGFLYVRRGLLDRIKRPQFGYEQINEFKTHVFPFDPPGTSAADVADYTLFNTATGHFATGTTGGAPVVQVGYSLDYIQRLGVDAIQAHRLPLLRRARSELVRLGYQPITPEGTTSPLLSFAYRDPQALAPALRRAKVKIALWHDFFRIAPSVFNDINDIDRLVGALS